MVRRKSKKRGFKKNLDETSTPTLPRSSESYPISTVWQGRALWLVLLVIVAAFFVVLKMFTVNAYSGDEHIYLYQAKLVTEGVAPYSGFAMAHPPVHALFTALVFELFGYSFLLGRILPVFWCLVGGLLLATMVRREYGTVASIVSTLLFLTAYEPLRASSHYTGINMTVALLIGTVFAYRARVIPIVAIVAVAAVYTRLYAIPGVLVLTVYALIANRKQGLRLVAWGGVMGTLVLVAIGLWTGFSDMFHNMLLYHTQKTPMTENSLVGMQNKVLFHNAMETALFLLAQVGIVDALVSTYREGDGSKESGPLRMVTRMGRSIRENNLGLVILSSLIAAFFLIILLNMTRVWMYYFIPSFPFAAVASGWMVSRVLRGAARWIRHSGNLTSAGLSVKSFIKGILVCGCFALCYVMSPRLEEQLTYYKRAMEEKPNERLHTYSWQPGLLPDCINDLVKSTLWREERVIGETYNRFNYLLWHESRILDIADEVVETIDNQTSTNGEIFGDSGTVPLFALLSERRVAANEVDTNIQRYRSGNADPDELIEKIDKATTQIIVLRYRFGVAGVKQVQKLIKEKYRFIKKYRTFTGKTFFLYRRRSNL